MDTLLEDLSAVIQIFLAGIIIFKSRSIRKYTESRTANYRLIIIETAFFVYAFSSLFHISLLGGSYTPIERGLSHLPHIVLIISHGFGTLFFILLAEVGLLYFLEQRLHSTIKKFSNFVFFVLSLIIFSLIVFHVMASLNYTVIKPLLYSTNIFIFFHILQISIIILVSLIILSRIITIESNKNPLFLSRKYPFGTGIVLLTLANLFHTTTYLVFPGSIVNYFEHIGLVLAPVALLIILKNIRSTDTSEISNEDTLKSEGGIIASINIF